MRSPASESENCTHGAKKIGSSQYSDFFNRIGQLQTSRLAVFLAGNGRRHQAQSKQLCSDTAHYTTRIAVVRQPSRS
jgi:hypothetical protein